MEERKLIYLINPIAGTRKKQQLRKMIERETSSRGLEYAILPTHPSGDYDDVIDLITAKGFTDVIAVGGDGTVNHVVQSMRHLPIRFGIIPVGSGNGLALAANIPLKLQAALSLIFEGSAARIDAFMINQRFSCLLSGLGLDARVAHEFAKANSRGLISYTQQSLLQFFKAQPYLFEIVLDQFSFFTDAFFISVANSNQFGNQVTIAPQASLNDGLLDIVIVQKMHKAKLPFAILKQIRGNNRLQELVESFTNKNILYFQTPSLVIKNPKLAPLHIDGEPATTDESFKIEILPSCFELIQPIKNQL
ncbi:MAG: YegS/Rv2252/BmrU family lipid kinase [Chitinophagaceae bacterium]|nr:YegS/Rv2252/BmrU family lipid kinase [Chitinophagaceae bacterium]